jgi:hypothetical protein
MSPQATSGRSRPLGIVTQIVPLPTVAGPWSIGVRNANQPGFRGSPWSTGVPPTLCEQEVGWKLRPLRGPRLRSLTLRAESDRLHTQKVLQRLALEAFSAFGGWAGGESNGEMRSAHARDR